MIRKHPLLMFMLIACGYSWGLWLLMLASNHGWLPFRFPTTPLGSFGPLIAALVLCRPSGLADSAKRFLGNALRVRPSLRWVLLGVLGPLLLIGLAVLGHWGWTGSAPLLSFAGAYWLPLLFLVILVVGGPVGEEFGWRGYVLPHLLHRRTPLLASALIAVLWLIWHLPLFWLEGAAQEGSSILGFAAIVASSSVLFTWCYLRTGPSLWPVLILHTSINLWSVALPSALAGIDASRPFSIAMIVAFAVAAVAVVVLDPRMRIRAIRMPGSRAAS